MEHLSLEIFDRNADESGHYGSKYAVLPEDASITVNDTSEIFSSGDAWSLQFTLNVYANAHIFGTSGDLHGSRIHEQLDKRKARLWVGGLPLYYGYIKLSDEVDVDEDGDVDVTLESGQKVFDDMIEGAKANQVPMMSNVKIGVALYRDRWACVNLKLSTTAVLSDGKTSTAPLIQPFTDELGYEDPQLTYFSSWGGSETSSVQRYPRMVFPKGMFLDTHAGDLEPPTVDIDCLNTDYPYDDTHPYCNVALCYQKKWYTVTKEENGTSTTYDDFTSEPSAQRDYNVMPANRVNSAPNFFVIYWLRSLMKHLGIHIEENQMMGVEDLRRLFFVNTNCAYEDPGQRSNQTMREYGDYANFHYRDIIPEYFGNIQNEKYEYEHAWYDGIKKIASVEECGLVCHGYTAGKWKDEKGNDLKGGPDISSINIKVDQYAGMSDNIRRFYDGSIDGFKSARNRRYHDAIATSECFPNVNISEVISALESGFGVRFLFDSDYKRVRIVLLRNLFRSKDIQEITCDIVSATKSENNIRGFKMTYGEQEDTQFIYKGFDDKLNRKKEYFTDDSDDHDYSQWDLDAKYTDVTSKVSAFNKTCYVDNGTGNAYIVKVDKDAKRYDELHPSLFECAGYMDAQDGDCTGDEETIETINVGFTPAIMNDVTSKLLRNNHRLRSQSFALFVDEDMRPRRPDLGDSLSGKSYNDADALYSVGSLYMMHGPDTGNMSMAPDGLVKPGLFSIVSDMYVEKSGLSAKLKWIYKWESMGSVDGIPNGLRPVYATCDLTDIKISGHVSEGYMLYLQDNFDPNDDGISPIEHHDWGLTLGIMRGSGSDAYVSYESDIDDGEGNDTWSIVPGSSATAHPDTCDDYGNEWDYDVLGDADADKEGRISLKLRAEKPNPYYVDGSTDEARKDKYLSIENKDLRGRGLCDQFYKEYSYWVRNSRIVKMTVKMELSQLLAIDKTKRVRVGDITGFIKKMQYSVSNKTGLGLVTMEIMYL